MFTFAHLSRSTDRLEPLLAFYLGLGCTLEKRVVRPEESLTRVVLMLPATNSKLQLIERANIPASPPPQDWPDHLKFFTPDLDAAIVHLQALGGKLAREPYRLTPDGNRIAFVIDPDGYFIELVESALIQD
jgi:catechol 2,3-dioxygenase-like lactoylglutathione lyase family enzyme